MPLPEKKKVMTSYDVSAVVKELKEKIVGRKIDNIYQLDERTFLFKLRPGPLRLLIEIERRLHLTVFEAKIPKEPTLFCKALRNRLRQGTIDDISQYRFERIVYFTIKTKEGKLTLIAELFRRGNLILIDENSKILLALRYAEMKDRCILPKETFKPPPTTG
ncbi:TPA: fibronectin-binding domain-containing protein, partial [Candidatus Bathyarchaeota archaeon]|nr:fibronectin-binding domain-containing protein [Candidatus Bathyarchaeota archaeon]